MQLNSTSILFDRILEVPQDRSEVAKALYLHR